MTSRTHILSILALALLIALASMGCRGGDEVEVQTGWDLFESGDYEAALASFRGDVQADSSDISARVGIGWCELSLDALDEASAEFSELLELDPKPLNAAAGMAYTQSALREYREATEFVDLILESRPNYAFAHAHVDEDDLHLLGARCLYMRNRYEESYEYLRQVTGAAELDPRADDFTRRLISEITRLER